MAQRPITKATDRLTKGLALALVCLWTSSAHPALVSRGADLVYDTDLNIT
jgi:hypothetical protein